MPSALKFAPFGAHEYLCSRKQFLQNRSEGNGSYFAKVYLMDLPRFDYEKITNPMCVALWSNW